MNQKQTLLKSVQIELFHHKPSLPKRPQYSQTLRVFLSLAILTAFLVYRKSWPTLEVKGIRDTYHILTQGFNRQLVLYPEEGSAYEGNSNHLSPKGQLLIGIGQILMDFWTIVMCWTWTRKVKNGRLLVGIAMFYLVRSVVFLNVQLFPFPDNLVWKNPGFFSFLVPYDHTRDFFYSGHTGSLTLFFLELFKLKKYLRCIFLGLSWIFMVNLLLITKVHYTVDIVGGLLFAMWFYWMGTKIVAYFDWVFSLPYRTVNWIYHSRDKKEQKGPSIDVIILKDKMKPRRTSKKSLTMKRKKSSSFDIQNQEATETRLENFLDFQYC